MGRLALPGIVVANCLLGMLVLIRRADFLHALNDRNMCSSWFTKCIVFVSDYSRPKTLVIQFHYLTYYISGKSFKEVKRDPTMPLPTIN